MATELICITCPLGCRLSVETAGADLLVSGNRCARGAAYAQEELRAPKRTVTATARLRGAAGGLRRLPVKSAQPFPRERVPELLAAIYGLELRAPVTLGQVLLADALGTGIDLVAARSVD
jgi:CxxC motif-containing protein